MRIMAGAQGVCVTDCVPVCAAIVMGKRGQHVLTDGCDEEHLSRGVFKTYTETNLRYSQVAPVDMYAEKNTGTNLPAQVCNSRALKPGWTRRRGELAIASCSTGRPSD
jgi:tartrate dehydratase alpha subunit/fumarate hydratase class I-like protein